MFLVSFDSVFVFCYKINNNNIKTNKKTSLLLSFISKPSYFYILFPFLLVSASLINMWVTFPGHQLFSIYIFFVIKYELHEGKKGNSIFFFIVLKAASGSSQVLAGHCDRFSQGSAAENKTRLKGMLLVLANFRESQ